MKITLNNPVRTFKPRANGDVIISDVGKIELNDNEMISFVTKSGREHDFVAKEWGFYATPSVNSRLKNEGFKTALVKNQSGNIYVMVVDKDKAQEFDSYCEKENQLVIEWIDEISVK